MLSFACLEARPAGRQGNGATQQDGSRCSRIRWLLPAAITEGESKAQYRVQKWEKLIFIRRCGEVREKVEGTHVQLGCYRNFPPMKAAKKWWTGAY